MEGGGSGGVALETSAPLILEKKSIYEELGQAFDSLDMCDSQSELSSLNSVDMNEIEYMFGPFLSQRNPDVITPEKEINNDS